MRAGLNIAVRVELILARQVPSCARNVTHDLLVTLLSRCHSSIAITDAQPGTLVDLELDRLEESGKSRNSEPA